MNALPQRYLRDDPYGNTSDHHRVCRPAIDRNTAIARAIASLPPVRGVRRWRYLDVVRAGAVWLCALHSRHAIHMIAVDAFTGTVRERVHHPRQYGAPMPTSSRLVHRIGDVEVDGSRPTTVMTRARRRPVNLTRPPRRRPRG